MTHKNKNKTDYTLSYLKFLAGFRASAPSARAYGLSPEAARIKRAEVDICLGRTSTGNSIR
jgi:hypothetical protein